MISLKAGFLSLIWQPILNLVMQSIFVSLSKSSKRIIVLIIIKIRASNQTPAFTVELFFRPMLKGKRICVYCHVPANFTNIKKTKFTWHPSTPSHTAMLACFVFQIKKPHRSSFGLSEFCIRKYFACSLFKVIIFMWMFEKNIFHRFYRGNWH